MAAHRSAAASRGPNLIFVSHRKSEESGVCAAKSVCYSASELCEINYKKTATLPADLKSKLGRMMLLRSAVWWSNARQRRGKRRRCTRKQKRGKQAGLLARLKATGNRPVILSIFLANVRALDNKIDLLRICMSVHQEMRKCCILLLTETWLNSNMPDSAFQISGMLFLRADRNYLSGKTRGGGLCVFINKGWCTNFSIISSHCSESVEHLIIKWVIPRNRYDLDLHIFCFLSKCITFLNTPQH